jgi:hypothetical protein
MSDVIAELVERTRREQGLPPHVENEAALSTAAGLLRLAELAELDRAS